MTTNHRARKIASKHQLNWPDMLPWSDIAKSQHEKIRRFQEQQLEQGYKRSKGISIWNDAWRFDCPAVLVPHKPRRQIASNAPMRWRTQRSFLKPRSTAPSSVHATPNLLRSASGFRTPVQCVEPPKPFGRDSGHQFRLSAKCVVVLGQAHILNFFEEVCNAAVCSL